MTSISLVLTHKAAYPASVMSILSKLSDLHVPCLHAEVEPVAGVLFCRYDGFTWPCRERQILDGYEEVG